PAAPSLHPAFEAISMRQPADELLDGALPEHAGETEGNDRAERATDDVQGCATKRAEGDAVGKEDDRGGDTDDNHLRHHQHDRDDRRPDTKPDEVVADQFLVTGHDGGEGVVDLESEGFAEGIGDGCGNDQEKDERPGRQHERVLTPPASRADIPQASLKGGKENRQSWAPRTNVKTREQSGAGAFRRALEPDAEPMPAIADGVRGGSGAVVPMIPAR